jgi:predicted cupin superfamily sugar epimerase
MRHQTQEKFLDNDETKFAMYHRVRGEMWHIYIGDDSVHRESSKLDESEPRDIGSGAVPPS